MSHPLLTPQQAIIAGYLEQALSQPAIAKLMGISPNTVRNQIARMYETFGVNNKTDFLRKLWNKGLYNDAA